MFAEMLPESHVPHRNTVLQLVDKVRQTGIVADAPKPGRPRMSTDEKVLDISD
jgi:hypothetical protein